MEIIKRDGRIVTFDGVKISNAILKAFTKVHGKPSTEDKIIAVTIADEIEELVKSGKVKDVTVEAIQDLVEDKLMERDDTKDIAKEYIRYRNMRSLARDNTIDRTIDEIVDGNNDYWTTENSNKNHVLETTKRDYIAGEVSTDKARRRLLPKDVIEAHDKGIIHFHDMDYFIQHIHNCDLINLEDMLQNTTVISGTLIEKPKTFSTACNIATQAIAQIASSQYGGQSVSIAHLSPFVQATRKMYEEMFPNNPDVVEKLVAKDIDKGVQILQYQVITLMTTNGQAPFITFYMNLGEVEEGPDREDLALVIEEILKQRIRGVKNEKGVYVTPAFPKLIYALDDFNTYSGSKYYYLTELAAECTAKRMVPDYISNKVERELKGGDTYTCMGCRSFLTPDTLTENVAKAKNYDKYKGHKYYGRFNQGVVTINLPYIAGLSGGDDSKFWEELDKYCEICHKALRCRHERLKGTVADVAPILWRYGALARLDQGETIDKLLVNNYSTISLGYAGIYEMTKYMTGYSHTDHGVGHDFAIKVMQFLNDKCAKWRSEESIGYSVYGTPLESTTYKFAKALVRDFGVIKDFSDHTYITNSFHVNVRENIDAFTKLKIESEFQKLSPGGMISYTEVPNMTRNIPAVIKIIQFIYENIMYAELNTKSDYCMCCGYDGEIEIKGEPGHLYWQCPNCGNKDQTKMSITRRTCGYLGQQYWNQGRTEEIKDRVLHLY